MLMLNGIWEVTHVQRGIQKGFYRLNDTNFTHLHIHVQYRVNIDWIARDCKYLIVGFGVGHGLVWFML